ncbi:erythritol phosphate/glycerol-3-phosphate dehydrogenase [Aurantimonas manganoxydans SI85-9A1]|uniref:Glycerol-3-phosphate dehydrogenase n=1 Tax=Aurantimonas manganoxydans (strain ATCC BAA-1229 / DSM 21871 / SI85-9A1) TaxID=287752 RepID=Q1YJP0_AURMS|nr:glycerol-3-phosphate dehydrogenase [Aurantimonas manganoxydans]EAS50833.1 erythritol phosphate/glycerol-3-phosphate dehydrogenase [Aurantimonas manganoxydans SI85-9A1]
MRDLGTVDILVIGGGVNGAGIARDAVGRGLSVVLCEKDDLAEGTSSRSGKLVHGGLRYLEYYEFRLVREALREREVLLRAAPHIIWPMRFVLPHSPEQRPAWLIRLGLFLYDHLGGRRKLPGTRSLDLRTAPEGAPIQDRYPRGFEYSDCWVDDARLVVLNALDAAERGATILTRTAAVSATRDGDLWRATLRGEDGADCSVAARGLVNAAGPWVDAVLANVIRANATRRVRLVKGSHIVTPKFWDGPQAYLFQNTDKRVIFVNPYQGDKALIGTTDLAYRGDAGDVAVEESEIAYLLDAVNRYVKTPLTRADVLHAFSGVRPLLEDDADNPSAVTRDYVFDIDTADGATPMLSIFGGKITTYRELAERGLDRLKPFFPAMGPAWTHDAPLPGGDMADADFAVFEAGLRARYPWLPAALAHHYARLYGTRTSVLLASATRLSDLGRHFGGHLYAREIDYLVRTEWAKTAEDILDRRTKHGLDLTKDERRAVRDHLAAEHGDAAPDTAGLLLRDETMGKAID